MSVEPFPAVVPIALEEYAERCAASFDRAPAPDLAAMLNSWCLKVAEARYWANEMRKRQKAHYLFPWEEERP